MHDKDATPIEAIDFETLQETTEPRKESKRKVSNGVLLGAAFLLLVFCAIVVFSFLPSYVADKKSSVSAESQPAFDPPPPSELDDANEITPIVEHIKQPLLKLSPEELNALKAQAEELLLTLIEKQKLLESKAVQKWADQEFKIAVELGAEGDEYFRKQEYVQAIAAYKNSVMVLNDLENKIQPTLTYHLEKGELALKQAEKDTAIFHFELANDIETGNVQAKNGLQRANTINELYSLLDQGGKLEAANRFIDAKKIYKQAVELDPLSKEAKAALDRVANRLAQNKFQQYIKTGYAALKQRQYGDARAAFTAAQKLSPGSNKPQQGIAEIDRAVRDEKIASLTTEAQHFETNQDWKNAAESYQQILSLSANSSTAQTGLERSKHKADLLVQLDSHIENKLRLSSESVSKSAEQLLVKISALAEPGSKITQRASTLEELIKLANQTISIVLESDNQTDVVIFKVGKFGKFKQHKLELKTGKYTIVGSRPGYRDVRKTVTITPDTTKQTILVRCEEVI